MITNQSLAIRKVKAICDYQFGPEITDILFQNDNHIKIEYSKNTGRIKYVFVNDELYLSFKPTNGFFTLSINSARKIVENTIPPKMRTIVLTGISDFIKKGRNVFCKHIVDIDDSLRPLDEVIVVNQNDELLAIGRLKIPIDYARAFKNGIAINVRKGLN